MLSSSEEGEGESAPCATEGIKSYLKLKAGTAYLSREDGREVHVTSYLFSQFRGKTGKLEN
jgi:hypothetical protein